MPDFRLVLLPLAAERIRHLAPDLKRSVREAMRAIVQDPAKGEPLKRELQDYQKFRVRRFRIIYRVDRDVRMVTIMAVGHRREIYEELAAIVRRQPRA